MNNFPIRSHSPRALAALTMTLLCTVLTFTSCDKPIYSEPPVYGTMFFSPDSIDWHGVLRQQMTFEPGQKVFVGITIEDEGAYITRATQTWELTGGGQSITEQRTVVAPVGKEPAWSFIAPDEPGEYNVSFREKYSYSAQTPAGTIYGESNRFNGRFRVR